mmetsp:Transcript_41090/g.73868  ORF Transcript_41090/g.73868 Transcript_41090/m.73868 type:complete len:228 (-) Transcript_41090:104-787(-)
MMQEHLVLVQKERGEDVEQKLGHRHREEGEPLGQLPLLVLHQHLAPDVATAAGGGGHRKEAQVGLCLGLVVGADADEAGRLEIGAAAGDGVRAGHQLPVAAVLHPLLRRHLTDGEQLEEPGVLVPITDNIVVADWHVCRVGDVLDEVVPSIRKVPQAPCSSHNIAPRHTLFIEEGAEATHASGFRFLPCLCSSLRPDPDKTHGFFCWIACHRARLLLLSRPLTHRLL